MSIRFENVSKSFGTKKILDRVSFEVAKGEILFILGQSGVGKSVTLKQIVAMMKPDTGQIFVDEMDVTNLTPRELKVVRKKCGMVFQHPALLDFLSVRENIAFGLEEPESTAALRRVDEMLDLTHLPQSLKNKYPTEISYGMQKRVSLARTVAPNPSYLLFDEPTTGLDPVATLTINDLILELSRKLSVTSIVVSHDMNCALEAADRILVLENAAILEVGTVNEIQKSDKPLIRDFLHEVLTDGLA